MVLEEIGMETLGGIEQAVPLELKSAFGTAGRGQPAQVVGAERAENLLRDSGPVRRGVVREHGFQVAHQRETSQNRDRMIDPNNSGVSSNSMAWERSASQIPRCISRYFSAAMPRRQAR